MTRLNLTIVQDQTDPESSEVLIEGEIGRLPYAFLLDTGAATSRLEFDEYTSSFASVDQVRTDGVFSNNRHDLIIAPSVRLGPIIETNFTVARLVNDACYSRNIIGMDFLKNHSWYFHFDENWVDVDPADNPTNRFTRYKLITGNKSHPYVDVCLGELTARALWDSGSGITIFDTNFVKKHASLFEELGTTEGTDSSGCIRRAPLYMVEPMTIGDLVFPCQKVSAIDLSGINSNTNIPMDLILGYNTMHKANWFLDFPKREWAIFET